MADIESNIRIDIDTTAALASLKNLQREISAFQTQMAKGSATTVARARDLQQELINNINSTGKFAANVTTIRTTTESFTNALEKNKLSMGEYFRYSAAASQTFGRNFIAEFNTIEKVARERVKTLQTQYIKLGRDANGAMQSIAIRPLALDMNDLGTRTAIAAQKQQLLNQLLKQGSTNLLNFGKNTQWAGRQLMVGFTIPLTMLGTAAARTFMEMEQAALKFRKVYGDLFTPTEERDQALRDIEELGKSFTQYGIAVSDTVGLAAEAAAAGFQGADLQRQTSAAVKLSILGQLEQQKALETTISLQNAFGMSSDRLAESIDFLNAVENQTVVSLDDITTAVPKVAPVIQQLGGDVKDLAFFLAAMKEGGVNASEGANALKSGLGSLINPTEKAAQMLSNLGINIRGIVQANQGDITGIVVGFAQALDRLDPLARAQAIEQLFGKFQFARLSTLFDNVIKQGSQAERVMALAGASTQELADMSQKELGMTAESAMNQFRKAVEDLRFALVPVGEEFLKAVTPLVQFASKVLEGFNNLDDGVKRFIINMTGLLGVIGPVAIMSFGLLANGVANVIKTITFLRNVFMKTGQTTNVLGQNLDYMNTEQLQAAAVAASLDQAHSKLIQTFTSEAGAVDLYTAALKRAVTAQQQFGGVGIATNIGRGKTKKMKKGGVVTVPGSGKGDKVPAMLEPGEAVIPSEMTKRYAPLIEGMIAGNIPGYQFGKVGRKGPRDYDFAHITDKTTIPVTELLRILEQAPGEVSRAILNNVRDYAETFGDRLSAHLYSGLGFDQAKSLNIGMRDGGAVSATSFLEDFSSRGLDKWSQSLNNAGVKVSDVADELTLYDRQIQDGVAAMISQNKNATITSAQLAELEKRVRDTLPATSRLKQALDKASQNLYEFRINPSEADATAAGLDLYQVPSRTDASKMSTKKRFRMRSGREARAGGNRVIRTVPIGDVQLGAIQDFNDQAASTAQTASESKRTKKIAKDTVDGYVNELERGKKKAASAGAATATQSARYRDPKTGRFAKDPALTPGGVAAGTGLVGIMDRFGARLTGLSFAMSAVSGVMMMFGGTVGEISSVLFGLSNAMFALIAVTQLLTQTKMGEAIASAASARAANVKSAMNIAEGAGLFARGGGIAGLFANLGRGLSFVLRFLGPVGLGLSALAIGVPILVGIIEQQRKKIEGLGNTANLTGDKLKKLGDIFGIQARQADFGASFVGAGGTQNQRTLTQQVLETESFASDFEEQISAVRDASVQNAELALRSLSIQLAGSGFAKEQVDAIVRAIATEAKRTDLNLSFATIDISTSQGLAEITETAKTASETAAKAFEDGYKPGIKVSTYKGIFEIGERFSDEAKAAAETAAGSFASLFQGLKTGFEGGLIDAEQFTTKIQQVSAELSTLDPNLLAQIMPTLIEKMGLTEQMSGITNLTDQLLILQAAVAGVDVSEYIAIFEAAKDANDAGAQDKATKARKKLANAIDQQAKAQEKLNITTAAETSAQELENRIDALQGQITAYYELVDSNVAAAVAYQIVGDAALYAEFQQAKAADAITGTNERVLAFVAGVEELNKVTQQFEGIGARFSGGPAKKSPFQEAVEQLKEQRKEIQQSIISYAKLRKAGVAIGTAFEASKDPILAAAIATTKVGTAAWSKLVKLINQANAELAKSQLIELVRERQADLSLKLGFSKIVPQLKAMGLELDDIQEIINDPALAQAFINDLKDGVIQSKLIKQYLDQIAALKQIEINIQLSTEQGTFDAFDNLYDQAMEMFDIQEAQIEDNFESAIQTAEDGVAKIEDQIAGIESEIADKQREIEIDITRPIEDLQEQMEGIQREIEVQFDRPIAILQEEASDLANDLTIMDRAAEAINKKYDAQAEALDKISELNQEILDQQKQQISLADALSQGDISAAAAIAQEMRASAAQASITTARDAIEAAREGELGAIRSASGLTREEIEQRQFEISQEIYKLEEQREAKQKEILAIQDNIYDLEQKRKDKLDEIRVLEDDIYSLQKNQLQTAKDELEKQLQLKQAELDKINANREAWNDAKLAADQARIASTEYQNVLEMTKFLIEGIKKTWDEIKSKTIQLLVQEVTLPAGGGTSTTVPGSSGSTSGSSGSGGGPTTDTTKKPNPAYAAAKKQVNDLVGKLNSARSQLNNFIAEKGKYESMPEVVRVLSGVQGRYVELKDKLIPQWRDTVTWTSKALADARAKLESTPEYLAGGGMVSYNRMGGLIPYKAAGGLFKSINTDTVPAMLTPGEFVMKRFAVEKYGTDMMKSINNGTYQGGTVYNSYSINVDVQTDANPDQIARAVMTQIKQIDSQRIRGARF